METGAERYHYDSFLVEWILLRRGIEVRMEFGIFGLQELCNGTDSNWKDLEGQTWNERAIDGNDMI
jgi:hypothetical protein